MNIAEEIQFGPVAAFKLGFGPIGAPLMCVYFFLLDGIIVDSGQRHMHRAALAMLAGRPVSKILMTHHHEDHSGNAAAIAEAHRVPIMGHPVTAEKMSGGFPIKPYQRYVWGRAQPAEVEPVPAVVESDRHRLVPIHSPGHSRDHTVFLEPDHGWLFAGDLYLGERIKFFRADEVLPAQIKSIKKVLTHRFEALFCAHNPQVSGGRARLRRKLQYLEDIRGQVQAMKAAGHPLSAVIRRLDPKHDRAIKLITLGNASFANMVRSAYND